MGKRLISLHGEELRRLTKLVHYQEVENIKHIQFKSEAERRKYLNESKACYTSALELLDSGEKIKKDYEKDETRRSEAAHQIFSAMEWTINSSFQCVRNYTMRRSLLNKATEYSKTLIHKLHNLDPNDTSGALKLFADAKEYEKAMVEYATKHSNPVLSSFSNWIKNEHITFESLLIRFKNKLKFEKPFKELENAQKVQVYEEILEASGRGRGLSIGFAEVVGAAGVAVLLFTAGVMVWDVYTSEHKFQTATRDAVVATALVGGSMLGNIVGAALTTELVGAEAAVLGVSLVAEGGFIVGIAGAFILSMAAGWLIDKLFSTGQVSHVTKHTTQSEHCYVAPMPDGKALAFQIAHQRQAK
ncbi:uncharacterized protein LOC107410518 [Ziziphus jujuba]|uniref:Uncharacterized protein LOC107410518 n=1 Tax=Ziziphus jujuba TaxID=326968 RepID=A0A6P3Z6S9_ZIZJJ|nr:uncharacterized protein LOC107410518 [Ziziphus jujuba]